MCNESKCCVIPVCLEFTGATATDEFKEQIAEMFKEMFENGCNTDDDDDD